ncbi:L,D-transpeptidase-like protein [Paraperlucidibaca baekdonensis]|uniref:L,D-transpeptidase-like protein n=2 Tax=Paraperlucidibaca baekdonensis TaxID=748120 RepID=A0A3E0H672_9GAMM|nr:L,D-transpeptidase-like protein [Paraperlucidibaca baekdonensis]
MATMTTTAPCTEHTLSPARLAQWLGGEAAIPSGQWLLVGISSQQLWQLSGANVLSHYVISTATNGPGERSGSECTPRGWHRVRARIGEGLARGAVLRGRRPTGEVWSPELHAQFPNRDWVLSRILWLCGNETGRNRGGDVDSQRRYIYFHGTPDSEPMGTPRSHGCIRMRNADIVALFERTAVGTPVFISEMA